MKLIGTVYIGYDRQPYIHIYRDGKWFSESIRLHLHENGAISASRSSKNIWNEWATEGLKSKGVSVITGDIDE